MWHHPEHTHQIPLCKSLDAFGLWFMIATLLAHIVIQDTSCSVLMVLECVLMLLATKAALAQTTTLMCMDVFRMVSHVSHTQDSWRLVRKIQSANLIYYVPDVQMILIVTVYLMWQVWIKKFKLLGTGSTRHRCHATRSQRWWIWRWANNVQS